MKDIEKLRQRAKQLEERNDINGIDFVVVALPDTSKAYLEIHFFNECQLETIVQNASSENSHLIFPLTGGKRKPAGPATDQVKVVEISEIDNKTLKLVIKPIGDYATYTLGIGEEYEDSFDPIFSQIDFKFRPGCFNTRCLLEREEWQKAPEEPKINYLAKDFDTFKHTLISAMEKRVPGWRPTSEADLDLVLMELISATADELSDYQDRVMNEAYISTARKRVSIARHARLMDYHIYQGHQSSTWLAIELKPRQEMELEAHFQVRTSDDPSTSVVYSTREELPFMIYLLNKLAGYTWGGIYPALKAGSTSVDLQIVGIDSRSEDAYNELRDMILKKELTHLVIQEWKHPTTGKELKGTGIKSNRQLLRLIPDEEKTIIRYDPLSGEYCLHVQWDEKDRLKQDYRFTIKTGDETIFDATLFHGNLVKIYYGELKEVYFLEPDGDKILRKNEYFYKRTKWGTICSLPDYPLSYTDVYEGKTPNGEMWPESTLKVYVDKDEWKEEISLIHSKKDDAHFIVETDEQGKSIIRFGNGCNGKALPENALVRCIYQVGIGHAGNIGADKLTIFNQRFSSQIKSCWNPFDVTNGREPESVEEILRNVPEAYRTRQLRAVTVNEKEDDYEKRVQELEKKVAKARACYRWNGSWRVVQVSVDPVGTTELSDELHKDLLQHVDAVRLIGDQIIIRPPKYVPLEIHVPICIDSGYWINDIRRLLEAEFSDGYTPDGREAFFNPDRWTFGQSSMKSHIIGRVQSIKGVNHVIDDPNNPEKQLIIRRWNAKSQYDSNKELVIHPNEIIQVKNDPNQMESGFIYFHFSGGRQ